MSKGSKRRPRDDRFCSAEEFAQRWEMAFGKMIKESQTSTILPSLTVVETDELNEDTLMFIDRSGDPKKCVKVTGLKTKEPK